MIQRVSALGQGRIGRCGQAVQRPQWRTWRRPVAIPKAATSSPSTAVAQSSEGLIFPCGQPGAWDEAAVGAPVVRCYVGDNEERWFLWYSGRGNSAAQVDALAPSSGSIGVALSTDGISWTRSAEAVTGDRGPDADSDRGTVLEPNKDWWTFDTCHTQVSNVQVLSNSSVSNGVGVYWCWYSGGDFEAVEVPEGVPGLPQSGPGVTMEGLRMRPGLAMSQDGRNWARIEGDHHTGALFDVGTAGEWDELFIGHPQVIAAGPKDIRMFYHSWDRSKGRYVIGLATSADGFRWTKQGMVFDPASPAGAHDSLGAAACSVVRDFDNKQFLMFYEAVAADGTRSIGLATSQDGLKQWQRSEQPVLTPSQEPGAWDSGSVGSPCAVSMSVGKWRLYYAGRAGKEGPWTGIGLALSVSSGKNFNKAPAEYKRRGNSKGTDASAASA